MCQALVSRLALKMHTHCEVPFIFPLLASLLHKSVSVIPGLYCLLSLGSERKHPFTVLAVSDNSKYAATANTGGDVHLYNIDSGQVC